GRGAGGRGAGCPRAAPGGGPASWSTLRPACARARARPSGTGPQASPSDRSCRRREARTNDPAVRGGRPGPPDDGRERGLRAELARGDRPEEPYLVRTAAAVEAQLPLHHLGLASDAVALGGAQVRTLTPSPAPPAD